MRLLLAVALLGCSVESRPIPSGVFGSGVQRRREVITDGAVPPEPACFEVVDAGRCDARD